MAADRRRGGGEPARASGPTAPGRRAAVPKPAGCLRSTARGLPPVARPIFPVLPSRIARCRRTSLDALRPGQAVAQARHGPDVVVGLDPGSGPRGAPGPPTGLPPASGWGGEDGPGGAPPRCTSERPRRGQPTALHYRRNPARVKRPSVPVAPCGRLIAAISADTFRRLRRWRPARGRTQRTQTVDRPPHLLPLTPGRQHHPRP